MTALEKAVRWRLAVLGSILLVSLPAGIAVAQSLDGSRRSLTPERAANYRRISDLRISPMARPWSAWYLKSTG